MNTSTPAETLSATNLERDLVALIATAPQATRLHVEYLNRCIDAGQGVIARVSFMHGELMGRTEERHLLAVGLTDGVFIGAVRLNAVSHRFVEVDRSSLVRAQDHPNRQNVP